MRFLFLPALLQLALAASVQAENEQAPFDEDFVRHREAALKRLSPGTDEAFFYRVLEAQMRGDLTRSATLLEEWEKRESSDARVAKMKDRQLLLVYARDPKKGRAALQERLELNFDHERPEPATAAVAPPGGAAKPCAAAEPASGKSEGLPVDFWNRDKALDAMKENYAESLAQNHLPLLAGRKLGDKDRTWLLQQLAFCRRSDFPGLLNLIAEDMAAKPELKQERTDHFGCRAIDLQLSSAQLIELGRLRPELQDDRAWAAAVVRHQLAAGGSGAEHVAAVEKALAFARPLPDSQNNLKASLLLELILCRERRGETSAELLEEYLALPRPGVWNLKKAERSAWQVNADENVCDLPSPSRYEDALIRRQLLQLFAAGAKTGVSDPRRDPAAQRFLKHIELEQLLPLYAEARLGGGCPDPDAAAKLLDHAALKTLEERVLLELLPDNPAEIAARAVPELHLVVRNAPELLMRIYKLDAAACCRTGADSRIDLEGLQPASQKSVKLDPKPMLRQELRLKLDEIEEPGLYAVDLIAGDAKSRAFIRKGSLGGFVRDSAAGQTLSVFDDEGLPVAGAVVELGEVEFLTDAQGQASLPFLTGAAQTGEAEVLIRKGPLATRLKLERHAESPELKGSFDLPGTLIPGRANPLLFSARLEVNGAAADLSLLKNLKLRIIEGPKDGERSRLLECPGFDARGQLALQIPLPADFTTARVEVSGEYSLLDGARKILSASVTLNHSGERQSIHALAFRRDGERVLLEMRGANGEACPGERIELEFSGIPWSRRELRLHTDAQGLVDLGVLPPHLAVRASWGRVEAGYLSRPAQTCSYPNERHLLEGEDLQLPLPEGCEWKPALFRVAEGLVLEDLSPVLKIEGAQLRISGLPPGDYEFHPGTLQTMKLKIHPGRRHGQLIASSRGCTRSPAPAALPQLISFRIEGEALVLQCQGPARPIRIGAGWESTPLSLPDWPQSLSTGFPAALSEYRDGGHVDEEQLYIFERSRQPSRPGVMLARPGLLLNPRQIEDLAEGDTPLISRFGGRACCGRAGMVSRYGGNARVSRPLLPPSRGSCPLAYAAETPWLRDFLPDAQGRIRIPLAELGSRNLLSLACSGPDAAWSRELALPRRDLLRRDLRLKAGLDPAKRYGEHRELRLVAAGEAVQISPVGGSRSAHFGSLQELWKQLARQAGPELAEFEPLLRWPQLDDTAKLEFYRGHACHEVHFFLSRRDHEFFAKHIRPFLANLLHPDFVDQALLGADLRPWLAPESFARLNPFEKGLLARSLKDPGLKRLLQEERSDSTDLFDQDEFFQGLLSRAETIEASSDPVPPPPPPPPPDIPPQVPDEAENELKKDLAQRLAGGPRLYAEPGPVRPWIEAGYWRRLERHSGINSAEALWIDYAAAEEGKPFFSPGLLSCGDCNSALLALAVSDLPFEAPQPHIHEDLLTPASPLIFAQSALRVDDRPAQEFPVLVSYATVDGNERRPHQGSFARGIVYAAKVRVNNLSEEAAKLSLLMQIPAGALALGEATSLEALEIPAFSSAQREILFYFPEAGDFHGVHAEVSRAGKVIGYSEPPRLQALETAPPAPLDTWSRIAEAGSPEQILQWLRDKPLKGEDLSLCAHLMKERKHYLQVLEILRLRHRFDSVLWSYSLFHDDFPALGEFLASGPLAEAAAPFFSSEILKVDAMRSGDYRHRDFLPLIHPRSFGKKRLADEGLRKQYQELLEVLRYKPELNAEDHLELAYYLLLQDRFTEAAEELALAPRFKLSARIQRDALECYLLFAQEKPQEAAKIAAAYEHYAIPHWREHFAEVTRQAAEIASGATLAGDKDPAPLAPALSCELRAGVLRADTANLKELRIEAHPVDVETLFSRTPFQLLGSLGGGAPLTAPAAVFSASPDAQGKLSFALPEKWSQVPLLLQVSGGGRRETLSQLPHSFSTRLAASQGQLQVLDAAGKGLGKVYVKVYARRGGQAVFHKDGFTDLRGRFDYASLNTSLEGIDAFAILVLGGKEGAAVLEAKPPQR